MKYSEILIAIFNRIEGEKINLVLPPVAFPYESFDEPLDGSQYVELHVVPNDTQNTWCGPLKTGNILFNLSYARNSNLIDPVIEAEKFLALFNEGLVFDGVTIKEEGTIKSAVKDRKENGRYFIPIVIKFEA